MKQFLLVALMTVVGFIAGYEGRIWQARHAHVPPPPGPYLGEFGRGTGREPINRAQIAADIEKWKPQSDAYNARILDIDAQFDQDLQALLTPDQKKIAEDAKKKHENDKASRAGDPAKPLTDNELARLSVRPFHSMVGAVVLQLRFDELNRTYKFDDAQQAKVMDLLKQRREKFLALVDSSPPPSIFLSRLAQDVSRIAQPAGASDKK